jgi:hypothetical protein
MEHDKHCPIYVDYVRECVFRLNSSLPNEMQTTLRFCISGRYEDCPFFRFINKLDNPCPYFNNCNWCDHYATRELDDFLKLTGEWCFFEKFTHCARYKMRESGEVPDDNLHPDGNMLPATG